MATDSAGHHMKEKKKSYAGSEKPLPTIIMEKEPLCLKRLSPPVSGESLTRALRPAT